MLGWNRILEMRKISTHKQDTNIHNDLNIPTDKSQSMSKSSQSTIFHISGSIFVTWSTQDNDSYIAKHNIQARNQEK